MSRDYNLSSIEGNEATGLDSYLGGGTVKTASARVKIASLGDLDGFLRTSSDTLIHKAQGDLWSIQRTSSGELFVERMFDGEGEPLKGL